jgi:hypothetical protein
VPSNLDLIRPSPCETRGAGSGTGPHGRDGGPVPVSHQTPLRRRCRLSTRRRRSAMSAPPAAISPDPAPNTPSAHPRRAHASRPKLTVARGRRARAPAPPAVAVIDAHRHFIDQKSRVASFQVRMSSIRPLCAVDVGASPVPIAAEMQSPRRPGAASVEAPVAPGRTMPPAADPMSRRRDVSRRWPHRRAREVLVTDERPGEPTVETCRGLSWSGRPERAPR